MTLVPPAASHFSPLLSFPPLPCAFTPPPPLPLYVPSAFTPFGGTSLPCHKAVARQGAGQGPDREKLSKTRSDATSLLTLTQEMIPLKCSEGDGRKRNSPILSVVAEREVLHTGAGLQITG